MNIQYVTSSVLPKWKNYRKYLKPIFSKTFELTKIVPKSTNVSIILYNDQQIQELNKVYRNINQPTDVLTFIDEEDDSYLGDVFINVDALERQAKEYGHTLKREFSFLVTHGLLHLLGFDHQTKSEEERMFGFQEEILNEIAPRN